ncbi:MAG: acetyltransferase [Candidatus Omnitrophica bacterium ADurb.Bin277]|nr:MAG: acetyltransferase [Candidatus Omnitrophica bacterium ADurb.Bin277]
MVTIRRCVKEDEPAVLELISGIMSREFKDAATAYPLEDVERISSAYGGIGDAFFVAVTDQNKVVGTVAIKKEDDRVALLRRLFVAPTHRNLQIGKKLITKALEFSREVGYGEVIFKTTSKMSGAIELCKKNGFIQRAHVALGPIELLKFSLNLNPQKG